MKAKTLLAFRLDRRKYLCAYGLPSIHVQSVRDSESSAFLAAKERWRWLLSQMAQDVHFLNLK